MGKRLFINITNIFQSTPSVWRVTMIVIKAYILLVFQSTPSVWRVTGDKVAETHCSTISIHTLRVEGDSKNIQSKQIIAFCSYIFITKIFFYFKSKMSLFILAYFKITNLLVRMPRQNNVCYTFALKHQHPFHI